MNRTLYTSYIIQFHPQLQTATISTTIQKFLIRPKHNISNTNNHVLEEPPPLQRISTGLHKPHLIILHALIHRLLNEDMSIQSLPPTIRHLDPYARAALALAFRDRLLRK